jgi:hypothetical protein
MEQVLAHPVRLAQWKWRRSTGADDPLGAMRGILCATLVSILAFWIPLAIALTG